VSPRIHLVTMKILPTSDVGIWILVSPGIHLENVLLLLLWLLCGVWVGGLLMI